MKKTQKRKRPNPLWRLFSSVKLTIAILIILAAASILGTLIPQGQGLPEFALSLSPALQRVFIFLDLFDMYHSIWFRVIMAALILNLIVCSVDRIPGVWKRFRARPKPDREKPFEGVPGDQELILFAPLKEVGNRFSRLFSSKVKRIREKHTEDRIFIYGEKGRYSHFGVYLVHLSVVIILVGGLIGSILGFEAFVNIAEGERVDSVIIRNNMQSMQLDFQVQCDDFFVDFYKGGRPSEYRSDLSFFVDGEKVEEASVRVNHPFEFKGITFYQSNYGTVAGDKVTLRIEKEGGEGKGLLVEAKRGEFTPLPKGEGQFKIADLRANFKGVLGPAVLVLIKPDKGKDTRFWIFKDWKKIKARFPKEMLEAPILNPSSFEPYTFHLEKVQTKYYTGLQANRNPGVPTVWAGCFLMVIGFIVTFFTSHRRIWVRLSTHGQGTRLTMAGTSNKNPVGLQRELRGLILKTKDLFPHKDEEND